MVPAQDALVTLRHDLYGQYLKKVYQRMATFVPSDASIIEVGVRPKSEDRGVISRQVIPHRTFVGVDRDPKRGELVRDVMHDAVKADVIISTCLLHHTSKNMVPRVLVNLQAPLLMLSGPNGAVLTELFGDHRWHLEEAFLRAWLEDLGYQVECERIGLSEPLSEILVIATERDA